MVKAVRFLKTKIYKGQVCWYCDNLPVGIVLFSDWNECWCCSKCLVTRAKFTKIRRMPEYSAWDPYSAKLSKKSRIENGKKSIVATKTGEKNDNLKL